MWTTFTDVVIPGETGRSLGGVWVGSVGIAPGCRGEGRELEDTPRIRFGDRTGGGCTIIPVARGYSSVGRALRSQCKGLGFDSP